MAATVRPAQATVNQSPSLFRNRTFVANWIANTASVLGDGFTSVALGLWVLQSTGSGTAMASVMAVRMIIGIVFGTVAGTVADRVDRRRLMMLADLIRVPLILGVAYEVASPRTSMSLVLLLVTLISVCSTFFAPAFRASLVNIVGKPELPQASALLQLSSTLAMVAGPLLAGAMVGFYGGGTTLAINAGTLLVSALLILLGGNFPSPLRVGKERASFLADMREGVKFMWSDRLVRSFVTLFPVINFFGNALGVLIPVVAIKYWMVDAVGFGIVEGSFPFGFAIGAAFIMTIGKRLTKKGLWMSGAMVAMSFFLILIALMPTMLLALPFMVLTGAGSAILNVLIQTAMQARVPAEVQGRVFGTLQSVVMISSPAAVMLAGLLSDRMAAPVIMLGCGVALLLIVSVNFFLSPVIRSFQ